MVLIHRLIFYEDLFRPKVVTWSTVIATAVVSANAYATPDGKAKTATNPYPTRAALTEATPPYPGSVSVHWVLKVNNPGYGFHDLTGA